MAMRNALTRQFVARALFLAAGLMAAAPVIAQAQGAPVPETHTVKKGDTLWDLAKTYFGDPLTWPQIYKMNTAVVEDPHWIYPGEVLRLAGQAPSAVPAAPAEPAAAVPAAPVAVAEPKAAAPAEAAAQPAAPQPAEPVAVAEAPMEAAGGGARPAGPIEGDPTALFGKSNAQARSEQMLVAYAEKAYRPLRPGEFYSAGFLTENRNLPYGKVLGRVTPEEVASLAPPTTVQQFAKVGIVPPKGASYQVGDSLLIAKRISSYSGYGDIIYPTGIAQVVEVGPTQVTAVVVNEFYRVNNNQVALPLERFTPGGDQRAVPVANGIEAEVIQARTPDFLTEQQSVLFLNKGREDGVAPGDVFEVISTPVERYDAAATIAQPMAKLQIVRVGDHTSSGLVVHVYLANVKPGNHARQVAKLPS
jgi:hypothetical protein